MRLVMFHPAGHPLERGWVGRVDGEHVTQLAAQTLQSFFTGGGAAREHAAYRLSDVQLLAPVLHPPSVRLYAGQDTFEFANPSAICSPNAVVKAPGYKSSLGLFPRLAAVVGADEEVAGFTLLAEWRRPGIPPPKDRDFALGLGPAVVTLDEIDPDGVETVVRVDGDECFHARLGGFDWEVARDLAAAGTRLCPGDLLAGPSLAAVDVDPGSAVEIDAAGIGALTQSVSPD